jgi:hypothetical protein
VLEEAVVAVREEDAAVEEVEEVEEVAVLVAVVDRLLLFSKRRKRL